MKKLILAHMLFLLFVMFTNVSMFAQNTVYSDSHYGRFATSHSRVVATINEFENSDEVYLEAILIGEFNVGSIQLNLYYDPSVVVPIMGPGGSEIDTQIKGTRRALGNYLWINPNLPNVHDWGSIITGQVNPQDNLPYTCILVGGNERLGTSLLLDEGNFLHIFKIYFKKLPGQTLSNNSFTFYEKLDFPQIKNRFSRGTTFVNLLGKADNINIFVNPSIFAMRVPSTIKTIDADVKEEHATLKGIAQIANRNIDRVHTCADVDWDTIVSFGFIYSEHDIFLAVDEYSKKIKVNGMEYDFPAVANGMFRLGQYTFYITSTNNSADENLIQFEQNIQGLDVKKTYYAYAYMKYKFQTSNVYPAMGERIVFSFGDHKRITSTFENATHYSHKVAKLKIFPNPTKRGSKVTLLLELPENEKPEAIAYFFDMNGRQVGKYKISEFSTEILLNIAKGTYLVKVVTKTGIELDEKFIVEN